MRKHAMEIITHFPEAVIYHDIDYAQRLIKNVEQIGLSENLNQDGLLSSLIFLENRNFTSLLR